MHELKNITITPEILNLIADIDEFKGRWKEMQTLVITTASTFGPKICATDRNRTSTAGRQEFSGGA